MFSVTYKLEPAHEATAARDLTRKLAEGSGRQRGGVGDGRTQQVQGWHHADWGANPGERPAWKRGQLLYSSQSVWLRPLRGDLKLFFFSGEAKSSRMTVSPQESRTCQVW